MKRHFQGMKIRWGRQIIVGCICLLVGCAVPGFEGVGQRDSISNRLVGKSRWRRSRDPGQETNQQAELSSDQAYQADARTVANDAPAPVGNSVGPTVDRRVVPARFQQPTSAPYPNPQGFPPPPNQGYPPTPNGIPYNGANQLPPTSNMQLNMAYPRNDMTYPPQPSHPGHAVSQYSQNGGRFSPGLQTQSSTATPNTFQPLNDVYRAEPPATDVQPQSAPPLNSVGSDPNVDVMSQRLQHPAAYSPAHALTAGGTGRGYLKDGSSLQGAILNRMPQTATEHALRLDKQNRRLAEAWNRTQLELDNRTEELTETRQLVSQKDDELEQARQEAGSLRDEISRLKAQLNLAQQETEQIRRNEKALLKRIQSTLDDVVLETLTGRNKQ